MSDGAAVYQGAKFRFIVEHEGLWAGGFTEVSWFDAAIDPIEYRAGNMATKIPQKVARLRTPGKVTLKKGIISGQILHGWLTAGLTAAAERKTVTITLLDEAQVPVMSWQVINAWPIKYTTPDFNTASNEIAIESLELAYEEMTMAGAGGA